MKKYHCTTCGHIYDPSKGDPANNIPPNTPFEELPEGWHCPICGEDKLSYEAVD